MLDMEKMPGSFNENEEGKIQEERKGRRMNKRQEGREEERIEKFSCSQWGDRLDNNNFSTLRSGRTGHRAVDPAQGSMLLRAERRGVQKRSPGRSDV